MTDTRIRAQAIVDNLGRNQFSVTVSGLPPHDRTRTYTIGAKDDNAAAMEGIGMFVEEMQILSGEDQP